MFFSNITALVERHKTALLVLLVLLLAMATLPWGLGRTGLWDPWEMDRAHVARQMTDSAGVVILERSGENGNEGDLSLRVRELGGEKLRVTAPPTPRHQPTSSVRMGLHRLKSVRKAVTSRTTNLLLFDLSLLVPSIEDESACKEVTAALLRIVRSREGLGVGIDVAGVGGDLAVVRSALEKAAAALDEAALEAALERAGDEEEKEPASDARVLVDGIVLFSGTQDEALEALVEDAGSAPWWRAQFEGEEGVQSVPILDFWLMALSFEIFGVSEVSARLPFLLWGLLGLLVVFLAARALFGTRAALLSAMVLVTTPFYVGAARHLSGEISFSVSLAIGVSSFLVILQRGWRWSWFALFLLGTVLAFLANGLTALLILWLVVLSTVVATGSWRREAVVPLVGLTVLFGGMVLLVLLPEQWTFFSHFKFMDHLFQGGPKEGVRNFDYFVRQVGFGAFPWSALLPFAFARMWRRGQDGEGASSRNGVILWLALPLFLVAVMLKDFSHCVYPGIPAMAVAIGVFLDDLLEGERPNALVSFVSFVLFVVIAKQIGTNAEPVAGYLTYDPHFDPKASAFPEEVTFPSAVRYVAVLGGLWFLVFGMKLASQLSRIADFFRTTKGVWTAAFVLLVFLGLSLVGSLYWQFQQATSRPELRALALEGRHVIQGGVASVFYVLLGLACLAYIFLYSDWMQRVATRRKLSFWQRGSEGMPFLQGFCTGVAALFGLGATVLFAMMSAKWGALRVVAETADQELSSVTHIVAHNLLALSIVVLAVLLIGNRLLTGRFENGRAIFRWLQLVERPAPTVAALVLASLIFTVTTSSVFAELSLHVSQKHVLQSYYEAEGAEKIGDNIFKHGRFGKKSGAEVNFYTNSIPAVSDTKTVLAALLREKDVTVRVADRQGVKRDIELPVGADAEHIYFLLPKKEFSELNHKFRKQSGGRHIPLLDAASSRLVLASDELGPGQEDENWLADATVTEEEMKSRDWFPESDDDEFHATYVNFDDKIELLGYALERHQVAKRSDFNIKLFFRCKAPLRESYKIFMHVDRKGSSHRIHSDHWPLNLQKSPGDDPQKTCQGCFKTSHWLPGDIVVDSFGRDVPLATPSGLQEIWLGLYKTTGDQKRLKVIDRDKKKTEHRNNDNRVKIGSFDV